jgi:hypothetical protein
MEHRTTFRRPISIPATLFNARQGFARATLRDLSFDGAFFADIDDTYHVMINSRIGVIIALAGVARLPILRFDGFVVRRGKGGIAIMFADDGPEVCAGVDRILDYCRRPGDARGTEENLIAPVVRALQRHTA